MILASFPASLTFQSKFPLKFHVAESFGILNWNAQMFEPIINVAVTFYWRRVKMVLIITEVATLSSRIRFCAV